MEPSSPIAIRTHARGLREASWESQPTSTAKSWPASTLSSVTTTDRKLTRKLLSGTGGSTFPSGLVLGSNSCISSEGHPRASPGLLHQPNCKHPRAQAAPLPSDPSPPPPSSGLLPLPSGSAVIQGSCSIHNFLSLVAAGPTHQPAQQHPPFQALLLQDAGIHQAFAAVAKLQVCTASRLPVVDTWLMSKPACREYRGWHGAVPLSHAKFKRFPLLFSPLGTFPTESSAI